MFILLVVSSTKVEWLSVVGFKRLIVEFPGSELDRGLSDEIVVFDDDVIELVDVNPSDVISYELVA